MKSIDKINSKQPKNTKDNFLKSSIICLANAERLIRNTEFLNYDTDTFSTSYALAVLAQEETAKAFLLYLVYSDALPWNSCIQRSLRDHECKQLWFIVLDALTHDIDFGVLLSKLENNSEEPLPFGIDAFRKEVGEMLNWYRYAKINTWERGYCNWDEKPLNKKVKQISKGKLDKRKQNALYVRIGEQGEVISTPSSFKEQDAGKAIGTAKRFYSFASNLIKGNKIESDDACLNWLKQALKHIFTPAVKTGQKDTIAIPGVEICEISIPIIEVSKSKQS